MGRNFTMWSVFILVAMWQSFSIATDVASVLSTDEVPFKQFERCLLSCGISAQNIVSLESRQKYDELNWQWNALNGYMTPMAYLVAKNVSDVQSAVICSKSSNVRVVARSGGHSYLKFGFGDSESVVIDLSHFNQVLPDPNHMICELGPGATAGRVMSTLWENGEFMTATAVHPSVGSGGVTLGGGYGHFTRIYGCASDNVVELEMVDANGKLLVINDHQNTDLFWALRGGGGGSFGIVTKLKLKMFHAPKSVALGVFQYNSNDFPQFYDAWQYLVSSNHLDNISGYVVTYGNLIELRLYYLSTEHSEQKTNKKFVRKITNLINDFPFPTVKSSSVEVVSYPQFLLMDIEPQLRKELKKLDQLANIDSFVGWKKVKSFYVDKILSKNEIQELGVLEKQFRSSCQWHFEMDGGAINKLNSTETAFVHRTSMFHVQLKFIDEDGVDPDLNGVSAMNKFYDKSKLLLNHRESYQNYLDGDITDYLQRYYGVNLDRLIEIKMKVDPDNVFRHPRSIPTKLPAKL